MNQNNSKGIKRIIPYIYITPITMILVVFVIGSVLISLGLGFTKYNILTPPIYKGMENYLKLMTDAKFIKALKNTLKFMIIIFPLQMVLGLMLSVFLVKMRKTVLGKVANCVIFIPFLCSSAVAGVVWRELLNGKFALIEVFFGMFGIKPNMLLGDAKTALITVACVAVWKMMGYYVVIFTSGLLGISETYYEAAKVDGSTPIQTFFSVTLPLLKPTLILAMFLSIIGSMRNFELIYNLTGGGPNNSSTDLITYAYSLCFTHNRAGYAMAVSNVLFVIVLVIGLMQRGFLRRESSEV